MSSHPLFNKKGGRVSFDDDNLEQHSGPSANVVRDHHEDGAFHEVNDDPIDTCGADFHSQEPEGGGDVPLSFREAKDSSGKTLKDHTAQVVTDIKERTPEVYDAPRSAPTSGFPVARHRSMDLGTKKKGQVVNTRGGSQEENPADLTGALQAIEERLEAAGGAENVDPATLLGGMSDAAIVQLQAQLRSSFPSIAKRADVKNTSGAAITAESVKDLKSGAEIAPEFIKDDDNLPLAFDEAAQYVKENTPGEEHSTLDPDLHAFMKPIAGSSKDSGSAGNDTIPAGGEAREQEMLESAVGVGSSSFDPKVDGIRFDFNGILIPEGSEVPTSAGLHHHGAAPGEAGYTLGEMVYLSRSTMAGQRAIALSVLAAVVRKSSSSSPSNRYQPPALNHAIRDYFVHVRLHAVFAAAFSMRDVATTSAGIRGLDALLASSEIDQRLNVAASAAASTVTVMPLAPGSALGSDAWKALSAFSPEEVASKVGLAEKKPKEVAVSDIPELPASCSLVLEVAPVDFVTALVGLGLLPRLARFLSHPAPGCVVAALRVLRAVVSHSARVAAQAAATEGMLSALGALSDDLIPGVLGMTTRTQVVVAVKSEMEKKKDELKKKASGLEESIEDDVIQGEHAGSVAGCTAALTEVALVLRVLTASSVRVAKVMEGPGAMRALLTALPAWLVGAVPVAVEAADEITDAPPVVLEWLRRPAVAKLVAAVLDAWRMAGQWGCLLDHFPDVYSLLLPAYRCAGSTAAHLVGARGSSLAAGSLAEMFTAAWKLAGVVVCASTSGSIAAKEGKILPHFAPTLGDASRATMGSLASSVAECEGSVSPAAWELVASVTDVYTTALKSAAAGGAAAAGDSKIQRATMETVTGPLASRACRAFCGSLENLVTTEKREPLSALDLCVPRPSRFTGLLSPLTAGVLESTGAAVPALLAVGALLRAEAALSEGSTAGLQAGGSWLGGEAGCGFLGDVLSSLPRALPAVSPVTLHRHFPAMPALAAWVAGPISLVAMQISGALGALGGDGAEGLERARLSYRLALHSSVALPPGSDGLAVPLVDSVLLSGWVRDTLDGSFREGMASSGTGKPRWSPAFWGAVCNGKGAIETVPSPSWSNLAAVSNSRRAQFRKFQGKRMGSSKMKKIGGGVVSPAFRAAGGVSDSLLTGTLFSPIRHTRFPLPCGWWCGAADSTANLREAQTEEAADALDGLAAAGLSIYALEVWAAATGRAGVSSVSGTASNAAATLGALVRLATTGAFLVPGAEVPKAEKTDDGFARVDPYSSLALAGSVSCLQGWKVGVSCPQEAMEWFSRIPQVAPLGALSLFTNLMENGANASMGSGLYAALLVCLLAPSTPGIPPSWWRVLANNFGGSAASCAASFRCESLPASSDASAATAIQGLVNLATVEPMEVVQQAEMAPGIIDSWFIGGRLEGAELASWGVEGASAITVAAKWQKKVLAGLHVAAADIPTGAVLSSRLKTRIISGTADL